MTLTRQLDVLDDGLGVAARGRVALTRTRWLAATGRHGEALDTCRRAVEEFGALAGALGGTELRAHVARHVTELVEVGLALALAPADPAAVFAWTERQRASALDSPPVRPPEDPELATGWPGCALRSPSSTTAPAKASPTQGRRRRRPAGPRPPTQPPRRRRGGGPVAADHGVDAWPS